MFVYRLQYLLSWFTKGRGSDIGVSRLTGFGFLGWKACASMMCLEIQHSSSSFWRTAAALAFPEASARPHPRPG